MVLGGDFNMVPWSYSVHAIQRATRTVNAGYAGGTFNFSYHLNGQDVLKALPPITIDHILVPETGVSVSIERREKLGSDHHGLLSSFTLQNRP